MDIGDVEIEVEGEAAAGVGARAVPAGEWEREPHPSDSLRTFGAVVQALREHAGLSREELAAIVQFSKHTVESVELGRRMPDEAFVELAEGALGNTGALRKAARHLSRGEVGLAAWFRQWARLEREAVSLCTYECRLVPGLLQSQAYARAVFEGAIPLRTDEELKASAPRNVTLQVVPLDAGLHACPDGPVQVLETPEGRRLGYSEGQKNGRLISDSKEVSVLCQRYETLRSQALNPKESRDLLERLRGEL
jgi:transcriptional regulator with XRE-family HTH domain